MKIFIDESGVFSRNKNHHHSFSFVAALVIPSTKLDRIYKNFKEITMSWPRTDKDEIKGFTLNAEQIINIAAMLQRYDCLLEVVAIDMMAELPEKLELHKKDQAKKITASITDALHPDLVQRIKDQRQRLEKLSMPQYIQATMLTSLFSWVARHSTLYYAQRRPAELKDFDWIIDAKDIELNTYEKWWKEMLLPFLKEMSRIEPWAFTKMPSFNYKYFEKYLTVTPEHKKKYVPKVANENTSIDLNKIMKSLKIQQSHEEVGIQLVDILVSSIRRLFT